MSTITFIFKALLVYILFVIYGFGIYTIMSEFYFNNTSKYFILKNSILLICSALWPIFLAILSLLAILVYILAILISAFRTVFKLNK